MPDAKKDILTASQWYEDQSERMGEKFQRKTINYIDKLQSDFVQYEEVYKGLRRIFMKAFLIKYILRRMKN